MDAGRREARMVVGEERLELDDVLGEAIAGPRVPTQCLPGALVGARGTAKTQVDAAGVERGEGAELLGNDERAVVGEHDAAGADAN